MIIPEGYSQVNLVFVGDNLPTGAQVTFGISNENDQTPAQVGADVITALVSSQVMDLFGDDEAITSIHVKNGPNDTGPFADVPTNLPGALTTNIVTPNVAILVKKVTQLGGRKGAGRFFWPGTTESSVGSDGTVDGGSLTSLETAFGTFLEDLTTNVIPMVLLHNDSTTPSLVTSLAPAAIAATQRRRMRR